MCHRPFQIWSGVLRAMRVDHTLAYFARNFQNTSPHGSSLALAYGPKGTGLCFVAADKPSDERALVDGTVKSDEAWLLPSDLELGKLRKLGWAPES